MEHLPINPEQLPEDPSMPDGTEATPEAAAEKAVDLDPELLKIAREFNEHTTDLKETDPQ